MAAARTQARAGFDTGRTMEPGCETAEAQIAHAQDVAKILVQNVVQGEKVEQEAGESYSKHWP